MADEPDLTPKQEAKEKKLHGLRLQNYRMSKQLEQAGVQANVANARIEHLVSYLVEQGVVTYDQQIDEQMNWELNLRGQLQPVLQQLKDKAVQAGVPHQRESGLVIPGMNGVPRTPGAQ